MLSLLNDKGVSTVGMSVIIGGMMLVLLAGYSLAEAIVVKVTLDRCVNSAINEMEETGGYGSDIFSLIELQFDDCAGVSVADLSITATPRPQNYGEYISISIDYDYEYKILGVSTPLTINLSAFASKDSEFVIR